MAGSENNSNIRIEGIEYTSGIHLSIDISEGSVADISCVKSMDKRDLPFIAPGLFDIQVNGINGADFNTSPVSYNDIRSAIATLYRHGITSFFPTLITSDSEDLKDNLFQISSFCTDYPDEGRAIAGIHLEGPFISGDEGPRGAHNKEYITVPDVSLLEDWQHCSKGMIKLITLAPELPGALEFIAKCRENGITVSLGHTGANTDQIRKAVMAGAKLSTHLGNGAHLLIPRHPNYLWDQLAEENLWASVIADGFHLPDNFMKVVFKVKGDHSVLISDSTKFTGMDPGEYYSLIGGSVVLTPGRRLHMAENPGILAGSAKTLLDCINYLTSKNICSRAEAWKMASVNPSNLVFPGIPHGMNTGARADLVLFRTEKGRITIKQTIKAGIKVYDSDVQKSLLSSN
jgi:N-acetylglucosamine-6-phosphate deacetylase